jgi:hypothetical protein
MAFWGRRVGLSLAVIITATVVSTPPAKAATCPSLPPATTSTNADWVLFAFVAPNGGRQVSTNDWADFDHTTHSAASGWILSPPQHFGSIAYIEDLTHPDRHDVVRVGNHTIERRGHQPAGSGSVFHTGGAGGWGDLKPCSVMTELVFVPGSHLTSARAVMSGAPGGYTVTYTGRGGGALLASDSTAAPAVAAGEYAGKFKFNWTSHGLVGGVADRCRSCKGTWVTPTGRRQKVAFDGERTAEAIAGPAGRWQLSLLASSGNGQDVAPFVGAPLVGAWADVGELRGLVGAQQLQ